MIVEIALIAGLGTLAVTVADHENLFQQNPTKLWFWERPPFTATTATRLNEEARLRNLVQRQMQIVQSKPAPPRGKYAGTESQYHSQNPLFQ